MSAPFSLSLSLPCSQGALCGNVDVVFARPYFWLWFHQSEQFEQWIFVEFFVPFSSVCVRYFRAKNLIILLSSPSLLLSHNFPTVKKFVSIKMTLSTAQQTLIVCSILRAEFRVTFISIARSQTDRCWFSRCVWIMQIIECFPFPNRLIAWLRNVKKKLSLILFFCSDDAMFKQPDSQSEPTNLCLSVLADWF